MSASSSWPSRERSPTPAKTEMPLYFSTMARISSITSTVLPTPAPPNIAALPPCASGASRSMTLMPVSKIAVAEVSSFSAGGGAWIGRRGDVGGQRRAEVARRSGHVEQASEHRLADRHRQRPVGGANRRRRASAPPSPAARSPGRCWDRGGHAPRASAARGLALRRRGRCRSAAGGRRKRRRRRRRAPRRLCRSRRRPAWRLQRRDRAGRDGDKRRSAPAKSRFEREGRPGACPLSMRGSSLSRTRQMS